MSAEPASPILAAIHTLDTRPDTRCIVGRWLASLDDSEVDELVAAVRRSRATTVHRALLRSGVDVPSETSWRKHWNGPCGCPGDAA